VRLVEVTDGDLFGATYRGGGEKVAYDVGRE
jgi:hypothetical protein